MSRSPFVGGASPAALNSRSAPRAVCGVTAGLVLADVLVRRRAGVTYNALKLALFFPSRCADQGRLAFVIAVDERRLHGGICVSKEIIKI